MNCPPLWSTRRRPDRPTWATPGRLDALGRLLHVRWLDWQRDVLATSSEVDPATGLLAYPTVGLSVGRQEGKSSLLDGVLTLRSTARAHQRSLYVCQDRQLAAERLLELAEGPAARYVAVVVRSNGRERVTFRSRSRWSIAAATAKAGRGRTVDLAVVDEAALLPWAVLDAIGPTQAARPDPQLWVASNAGDLTSVMFWHYTELGRDAATADPGRAVAWFEWGAGDDVDRADPATWRGAMPSLGHTITETFVATKLAELAREPERFDREYLNRWPEGMGAAGAGLDLNRWGASGDAGATITGRRAFAFDVAVDRGSAAIVAAGRSAAGKVVVEVVDQRPGTEWVVDALAQLRHRHRGATVAADDLTCAALIIAAGRRHVTVDAVGAATIGRACLAFDDLLTGDLLRHREQVALDRAVAGARRRHFGDAWAWSRARSTTDIAPLVAGTLAVWSHLSQPAPVKPVVITTAPS